MKDWTDFAKRYPESFIQLSNGKWLPVIAGGKGGGSSTTVIPPTIPPKSPEELGLLRKQTELLDIQIAEVRRQNDALQAVCTAFLNRASPIDPYFDDMAVRVVETLAWTMGSRGVQREGQ